MDRSTTQISKQNLRLVWLSGQIIQGVQLVQGPLDHCMLDKIWPVHGIISHKHLLRRSRNWPSLFSLSHRDRLFLPWDPIKSSRVVRGPTDECAGRSYDFIQCCAKVGWKRARRVVSCDIGTIRKGDLRSSRRLEIWSSGSEEEIDDPLHRGSMLGILGPGRPD